MAEQLASVAEERTVTGSLPPPNYYRDSIRSDTGLEWCIRSTLSSQFGQSGSNYSSSSGTWSSTQSNYSVCSSRSAFADGADLAASELTKIAQRMIKDGYTQRVFQAYLRASSSTVAIEYSDSIHCTLKNWFVELDVDWVLQIRNKYELPKQLQLKETASWLQELVERWIRALTVVAISIKELVSVVSDTPAVAWFGNTSISLMLVFVDAVVQVDKAEKLQAILHMYVCICSASYEMLTMGAMSSEAQGIFNKIGGSLQKEENRLTDSIFDTMMQMRQTLMKDDDDYSWSFEVLRGGGEVHRRVRLLVDCILLIRKAKDTTENSAQSHNTKRLGDLILGTFDYLKDLLQIKSELCSDLSLRYMFLLNNSHFIAQVSKQFVYLDAELWFGLKITRECVKYINSYLEVSWCLVMSCLSKWKFHGLLQPSWTSNSIPSRSRLGEFKSSFHRTYQAQKFWKVPDPELRAALRKSIAWTVTSVYRDYLKVHPEMEKYASHGDSSPDELDEMLAELFEG